ncbi:MAG: ABC transporter ATP-binding protein [Deltaproteobacteria bacterium]|nr:ABC transporter ATP-binding protein [Deltaproteobacteria bacterium]
MSEPDVSFGKVYDARLLARLWEFVAPHRGLFAVAMISYPLGSVLHLAQPYLVKLAIDDHLVPKKAEGFALIAAAFVAAIGLEFVFRFIQSYLTQKVGQVVTKDLRRALFRRLLEVDVAYVESNPVGRLMTRVTNDVESIAETFSTGAVSLLGDLVTLAGIIGMMLVLDVELTLASFAAVPLMILIVLAFRKPAREAFRDVRSLVAKLNGALNEAISGMAMIQSFRVERPFARDLERINGEYRDANFRAIRFDSMTYAIAEGIGHVSVAALLVFGLSRLTQHQAEIGVFVAFTDYLRRFFGPITELSNKYTVMQSAMASAERCVELLDRQPTIVSPVQPRALPRPIDGIRFDRVSFSYKETEPVLRDLELEIRRGEKVAIVGPTGSGKSTIVKLLCRFYDPGSGAVRFDGIPLSEVALDDLRGRLAVVLQDPYVFSGSIRDNISLRRPDVDDAMVMAAAERTRASVVIGRRPGGLDAEVGERGTNLSSGERQLIAFARALVLDPEVLVLDEATSSVDPETEGLIQEGLNELLRGRTAIVIAHRLSTVESADRIVVMKNGAVAEQGSHRELLAKGGIYRNLFELQFQGAKNG